MKPIAIFLHSVTEGPGYFATYIEEQGIAWRVFRIDEGEPVPADPRGFSGLVFMGGPMSVNDALPWIPPMLSLIQAGVAQDVPVLGHCLGGQLIARALGGEVIRNPVKEIGWGRVEVTQNAEARRWFGELADFESFHWHGETFSIPPDAQLIASSDYCKNQAFSMGRHLAMQCHVEMTPELIRAWCADWHKEVTALAARTPSVQSPEEMLKDLNFRTRSLNEVAKVLYDRWIAGLDRAG